jgi:16S rRNA (cytidine1402-2'-O)-methyltransferase
MPGILYVVATPIGNLEDVTLRALRILRDVSLIAAEDTRRTGRLLQHYSISTRTTSLHEHNEREKTPKLIERLLEGESIALVSDAGTPLISDPGHSLVEAARTAGVRVEAIPGASAVMTALAASGFDSREFTFVGFPPSRATDRLAWFERLVREPRLVVLFEAPHRIGQTLRDLERSYGPDHRVGVARELTKIHEELVIRPIRELVKDFDTAKGELTVLVPPRLPLSIAPAEVPEAEILKDQLGEITDLSSASPREAMRQLARRYGISANELYRIITKASK